MNLDRRFEVLCVCTGNICRSPIAEFLLRSRLAELSDRVHIGSAGTHAVAGRPMEPYAERVLTELNGHDQRAFCSQPLTAELVAGADLILTAERGQREQVLSLDGTAWSRTFTVQEFARLVTQTTVPVENPVARLRALVAHVAEARGVHRAERPDDDDLKDPIGARYRVFRKVGHQIDESVALISSAIVGVRAAG